MEPSFDEWVESCFGRKVTDVPLDQQDAGVAPITSRTLAVYLAQVFEQSSTLPTRYSTEQIGEGLWFICSTASGYFHEARDASVPVEMQVRWVRSIRHLYSDVFAVACNHHYGHLDSGPEPGSRLNSVCYMLWDLDCLEGAAMFPGGEHLVEPIFEVLAYALDLRHPACVESALHGLGHLKAYHPARVRELIEPFLARDDQPVELLAYARAALSGCVN